VVEVSGGDDHGLTSRRPTGEAGLTALAAGQLFIALSGNSREPFVSLMLPDGRRALPVFTTRDALEIAAFSHPLLDHLGELRVGELPGRLALGHVARANLDAAVLDLGSPSSFVVLRAEIDAVLAKSPRRSPSGAYGAASRKPGQPMVTGEPLRILVVDDDEAILRMLRRFFESRGAIVETSGSPFGVTNLLSRVGANVLVLDVSMPALDGEQVASFVRAMPTPPGLVFFSAISRSSLDELATRVSGAECVPKDAGLDVLWSAVMRARRLR
jgi:CheY-like chemotaxis protein